MATLANDITIDIQQLRKAMEILGHNPKDSVDPDDIAFVLDQLGHGYGSKINQADIDVLIQNALTKHGHNWGSNLDPEDMAIIGIGPNQVATKPGAPPEETKAESGIRSEERRVGREGSGAG